MSSECVQLKQLGEACTLQADECVVYAHCDGGQCRLDPTPGEACTTSATQTSERKVVPGSPCDSSTLTCVARKPVFASCSTNDECSTYWCDGGSCADTSCHQR